MSEKKIYLNEIRKKLNFQDIKFPNVSMDKIRENLEMIASIDEDYITIFLKGIITRLELIDLLTGKKVR